MIVSLGPSYRNRQVSPREFQVSNNVPLLGQNIVGRVRHKERVRFQQTFIASIPGAFRPFSPDLGPAVGANERI